MAIDKPAKEILAMMKKGLKIDHTQTREEIYETDRYYSTRQNFLDSHLHGDVHGGV